MSLRLFLAVLLLCPSAAAAQVAGVRGLALPLILQVKRVETTVTVSERIGSGVALEPRLPGGYETVDRTELDRVHAPSVNDALRKVSGVIARDEEGLGLRPNIALRGLNPTRSSKVLLLEDGIPLTFAPYGDNASYYHPPIERFDSIEVLKGSGQIAYGPSTVGGVINYITPAPPLKPSVGVTLAAGDHGYTNATLTAGGTWGRVGALVDFMRKGGDGARENTHSMLYDLNTKLTWTVSS